MKILESQISSVTVFTDRAQITRTASLDLEQGEHTLIFDKLPNQLDQKSVQVSGEGNAILANVKFQKVYYTENSSLDRQAIAEEKLQWEDKIHILTTKINRLKQEKEFIQDISKKITSPVENQTQSELEPEKWLKMLDFYREKSEKLDTELWEAEKEMRDLREKLNQVNHQLAQAGGQVQKTKNQVSLIVQIPQASNLTLFLSYIVTNARWYPVYDLRVSTETKQMNLTYNAVIQQNTSENWEEVTLQLSTAQPSISGNQPSLSPWHISLYVPKKEFSRSMPMMGGAKMDNLMTQNFPIDGIVNEESDEYNYQDKGMAMKPQSSVIETKTTSVFFTIAGKHTVKSDNTDHKVTILIEDFSAHFRYSTVPKLTPYAYLKAKVLNNSDFPLLAGESNVFLDNNFVANSYLEAVAPTEEFWTFLGIDEGIKVEHKFLKKYEKKEGGIFTKKTKNWLYEYQIKLKSFKKTTEEIVVWDQLPISGHDSIKVNLIEPIYKEDSDKLKKTEWEYLEWFFNLKSGEEILIPFKFSVEYPQDAEIIGMS